MDGQANRLNEGGFPLFLFYLWVFIIETHNQLCIIIIISRCSRFLKRYKCNYILLLQKIEIRYLPSEVILDKDTEAYLLVVDVLNSI